MMKIMIRITLESITSAKNLKNSENQTNPFFVRKNDGYLAQNACFVAVVTHLQMIVQGF